MATQFHNFDLELYDYKELPSGEVSYAVRVSHTPREQVQAQPDVVRVPQGFAAVIAAITQRWQHRDANALAGSCTQLGQWLFPPGSAALGFLRDSHGALGTDEALSLRLKCASAELACVPWEYASVDFGQPN